MSPLRDRKRETKKRKWKCQQIGTSHRFARPVHAIAFGKVHPPSTRHSRIWWCYLENSHLTFIGGSLSTRGVRWLWQRRKGPWKWHIEDVCPFGCRFIFRDWCLLGPSYTGMTFWRRQCSPFMHHCLRLTSVISSWLCNLIARKINDKWPSEWLPRVRWRQIKREPEPEYLNACNTCFKGKPYKLRRVPTQILRGDAIIPVDPSIRSFPWSHRCERKSDSVSGWENLIIDLECRTL